MMEHPLYQTGFFVVYSYAQFMALELFFDVLFTAYSLELQAKNVALIMGINLLLVGLFHGLRTALTVSQAFFLLLGIANYFVILFRGYGIVFMDLHALGTAATVAGNYQYDINAAFVAGMTGGLALFTVARCFLPRRKHVYTSVKHTLLSIKGTAFTLHDKRFIRNFRRNTRRLGSMNAVNKFFTFISYRFIFYFIFIQNAHGICLCFSAHPIHCPFCLFMIFLYKKMQLNRLYIK